MSTTHSLLTRALAGASTVALATGALLAGAGAAHGQAEGSLGDPVGSVSDSVAAYPAASGVPTGSLAPDRCLGVNPATGLPGYADVYIGGDHDPGVAWIQVVAGSASFIPPMLFSDNVPLIRYTLDWNNVDNDESGTIVGETRYGGQGQSVSQDSHQVPSGAGTVEWTLREVTMFNQPGAIGSLGSLIPESPMSDCSGADYVN